MNKHLRFWNSKAPPSTQAKNRQKLRQNLVKIKSFRTRLFR